jgi:cytoskeletal protein CcmA (bactofilin family)
MAGYIRQSSFVDGDTITAALFNNEYNQLLNAFNNATGHAHDGTAAEGPVIGLIGDAGETAPNNKVLIDTTNNFVEFYVQVASAPVQQLYIADGAIIPVTDSDIDLGTSSLYFKNAYIDSITTTGNIDVGGNLTVTGTTTFNGGTITMGDAATDNVVFGADIDSNIIPDDDNTYDLGSTSQEWRNLYIDGTANIDSLVADTADINGGTIDGSIIGGTTAAAITGTAITGTSFVIGSADISEAELETIDGVTAGTVAASKAIVVDANKDITGGRNITITGEIDAATLDISGNADIDGTLEADAITIGGITLAETIADTVGAMVSSNTETGIAVSYDDADNTLDFVIGDDAIVQSMIADDAIDSQHYVDGSIDLVHLSANSVDSDQYVDGSIDLVHMSINSIDSDQYVDGSIDLVHMSANSVDSDQYVDGSIDLIHMSANSVDSDQYVDGSIDTVHLADDAVTGAKLADNIDIAGTLDVTGILTADSNVVVAGNLTVNGTTTTLNTATLDVEDKNITINYGAGDTSASANGAGITIQDAIDASNDATILWDTTNDEFDFSHAINVTGNIAVSGTVDGRDVATDGTKLDGIEALADVTDATNVTAAGALMDSELTAIASVKALNQGVATTDSPTFVNVTGTSLDISGDIDVDGTTNLDVVDVDGAVNFAADVTFADGADIITASAGTSNFRAGVNAGNSIESGGNYNTVVGDEAGTAITTGGPNTAVGYQAGTAITTGDNNTAMGYRALYTEDTGNRSVAIGDYTLTVQNNDDSNYNTAVGYAAGAAVTTGTINTLIGGLAGSACTVGNSNVAVGYGALQTDTAGDRAVAIGVNALVAQNFTSTTDNYNVAVGYEAGSSVTTGVQNTFLGSLAGDANTTASNNTAVGYSALGANTTGTQNVAVGTYAGDAVTTGGYNCIMGYQAGTYITDLITGDANCIIGSYARTTATDSANANIYGSEVTGAGGYTTVGFQNDDIRAAHGSITWATVSDERYKKDITDSTAGLSFINALQPRTFKYKTLGELPETFSAYEADSTKVFKNSNTNHGFIAQEVKAAIDADDSIKDGFKLWDDREDGSQEVAEAALIPVLVKAIQELSAQNDALTTRITALEG